MSRCGCTQSHRPRRIVLTGGPGAGKTAVLEMIRQTLCEHVHVLPESAGIVFGGGFPRNTSPAAKRAAQRAIFHVQQALESTVEDTNHAVVLCDRGTIDGTAYWPGPGDMLHSVGTTISDELARYHAVIHLRTPSLQEGYKRDNPLRLETAEQATAIDARIGEAWQHHPRRYEVPATSDFLVKVTRTIAIIHAELPACCHWRN
jgi:predicted ATPase